MLKMSIPTKFLMWITNTFSETEGKINTFKTKKFDIVGYGYHKPSNILFIVGIINLPQLNTGTLSGNSAIKHIVTKASGSFTMLGLCDKFEAHLGTIDGYVDCTIIKHTDINEKIDIKSYADLCWTFIQTSIKEHSDIIIYNDIKRFFRLIPKHMNHIF